MGRTIGRISLCAAAVYQMRRLPGSTNRKRRIRGGVYNGIRGREFDSLEKNGEGMRRKEKKKKLVRREGGNIY